MTNEFAGRCIHCRKWLAAGTGALIDLRGRLILYCHDHTDAALTQAQLFVRQEGADVGDGIRRFGDGSIARHIGDRWMATAD